MDIEEVIPTLQVPANDKLATSVIHNYMIAAYSYHHSEAAQALRDTYGIFHRYRLANQHRMQPPSILVIRDLMSLGTKHSPVFCRVADVTGLNQSEPELLGECRCFCIRCRAEHHGLSTKPI